MRAVLLLHSLVFVLCKKTSLAADFTLQANDTAIKKWPRLIYDGSNVNLCKGDFQFEFKTFLRTAVVLYQDDGEYDFLAMNLEEGRLYVLYEFGMYEAWHMNYTTPTNTYNDFEWHSVMIRLDCLQPPGPCVQITIDKKLMYQVPRQNRCRFQKNLQIGGFTAERLENSNSISHRSYESNFNFRMRPAERRGFFNACVRNIKYGETRTGMRDISKEIIEKYRVSDGCHLNYCHKPVPICKNKGRCSPVGKKKKGVSCDCRWTGFEGPYCTKRALELTLDGRYRVKHSFPDRGYTFEKYTFRIKTKQESAVLFLARRSSAHDFIKVVIERKRLKIMVNLGDRDLEGGNFSLTSKQEISDGRWHFVRYTKEGRVLTLKVDDATQSLRTTSRDYTRMDYGKSSYLGEISDYKYSITIQDFIWETRDKNGSNFVTGLFATYEGRNEGYSVEPRNVLPRFNRKLPSSTAQTMASTYPAASPRCREGSCSTQGPSTTDATDPPKNLATGEDDDEDDSSITWIVVVTVIFALLLLAAVAFFIHKWNQRYSGDFQVNRKPIGPAGTVVHYQEAAAHKEKQRQMRL